MRAAADRAVAAIRECAPFPFAADPMLEHNYDAWDELELVFRLPPSP
jgi:hypothetical protein